MRQWQPYICGSHIFVAALQYLQTGNIVLILNGVRRLSWRRRIHYKYTIICHSVVSGKGDLIKILLERLEVYINKKFQTTGLVVRLINSCKHLHNWIVNTTNDIISRVIVRKAYVGGWCHRNVNAPFIYFRVFAVVCCNILCCLCTRLQNVKPIDYFYQFFSPWRSSS